MKKPNLVELESYNPDALLDLLIDRNRLRCDAALARALDVGPPVLSKIRHRSLTISSDFLVRVHDVFGLDLDYSRKVAGIPFKSKSMEVRAQTPDSVEESAAA